MATEQDGILRICGEDAGATPWEWAAITEGAGNTFSLEYEARHKGYYGYKALYGGTNFQAGGYQALGQTIGAGEEVYVRCYVYIKSGFEMSGVGQRVDFMSLAMDTGSRMRFSFEAGTTVAIDRWHWAGNGFTAGESTTNFSFDAWHRVEVYWRVDSGATDGAITVWVDGTQLDSQTGLVTQTVNRLYGGQEWGFVPTSGSYFYVDDFVVDTEGPIGEYDDLPYTLDGEDAGSEPWEFSSLTEDPDNDFRLDAAAKKDGSYGYMADFGGTVGSDLNYGMYWGFQADNGFSVKFDVFFPSNHPFYNTGILREWTLLWSNYSTGGNASGVMLQANSSGVNLYRFYYRTTVLSYRPISGSLALNQWHTFEFYTKVGTDGIYQLWVDGKKIDEVSWNTSPLNFLKGARIGMNYGGSYPESDAYFYIDNVQFAETPIGPFFKPGGPKKAALSMLLHGGF